VENKIDPGERWAAVLGVGCVLSKEIERITADQKRRAYGLELEIAKLAKALVTGSLRPEWPDVPKYKQIDDELSAGFNVDQIQAMIAKLPSDDQMPYMTTANRQFEFLSHGFPRSSIETLAGPVFSTVSSVDLFRFWGLYRVIDNPLYVFELMGGGALLRNQAQAVRAVFPALSEYFDTAIRVAITNEKAKNKKYEVPYRADAGIRDWLGLKIVIKPYQVAYVEGAKLQENKPEPSKATLSPESKASLSATQGALYQTVGR
jgi:hypothetical protein